MNETNNKIMEMDDFLNYVSSNLFNKVPELKEKICVQPCQSQKMNSLVLNGIMIKQQDEHISPCIYLDDVYQDYRNQKMNLDEVLEYVLKIYQQNSKHDALPVIDMSDYDALKSRVLAKIVNTQYNETFLENRPHLYFGDLAIYFVLNVDENYNNSCIDMTTDITCSLADQFGVNAKTLLDQAVANMKEQQNFKLRRISDILGQAFEDGSLEFDMGNDTNFLGDLELYAFTTKSNTYGSSVFLLEDEFQKIANKFNSDLYILPSSVHELILKPTDGFDNVEEIEALLSIIDDVNHTMLEQSEFLSNNIYMYDRKNRQFLMSVTKEPISITEDQICQQEYPDLE